MPRSITIKKKGSNRGITIKKKPKPKPLKNHKPWKKAKRALA